MKCFVVIFALLIPLTVFNQNKFKHIVGRYANNVGSDLGEKRAVAEAKKMALAYFDVNVRNYKLFDILPVDENLKDTVAACEKDRLDELVTVSDSEVKLSVDGKSYVAIISGNVKKDKAAKKKIELSVSGLQNAYYNGDMLTFNLKVDTEGYIHLFVFDKKEGWKLYPLENEPFESIKAGVSYNYPIESNTKIFLEKSDMRNKLEHNTMVFIATLQPIKYDKADIDLGGLMRWLYSIPYYERDVKLYNIQIK